MKANLKSKPKAKQPIKLKKIIRDKTKITPKESKKFKKQVLLNIPYVAFFYAFWRLHALYHFLPYPDWLMGLIGVLIIKGIVYTRSKNAKKYRKNVEYGSARWSA